MATDSDIGVVRHAQAGYEISREVCDGKGPLTQDTIKVPLWWSPLATFGPEEGVTGRLAPHSKVD